MLLIVVSKPSLTELIVLIQQTLINKTKVLALRTLLIPRNRASLNSLNYNWVKRKIS